MLSLLLAVVIVKWGKRNPRRMRDESVAQRAILKRQLPKTNNMGSVNIFCKFALETNHCHLDKDGYISSYTII